MNVISENHRPAPATRVAHSTDSIWEGHMAEDGGSTSGPVPCASLTANVSELCIRGTRGEFHVPRSAIRKISKGKLYPWLFQAVQIHHSLPRCSAELQFKPTSTKLQDVLNQLRELGYPVG